MANIIMVVTNEPYIAKSQLSYLNEFNEFDNIDPYNYEPTDDINNIAVTAWKSINTEEIRHNFIMSSDCTSEYNIIYVPFSALCFTIAKDRSNNNKTDRYMLVSIKERYKSSLISLGLYTLYFDSRKKIPPSIIKEYFDSISKNILLTSEYDILIEKAKELYQKPNHGLLADNIVQYLEMTT